MCIVFIMFCTQSRGQVAASYMSEMLSAFVLWKIIIISFNSIIETLAFQLIFVLPIPTRFYEYALILIPV